MAPPRSPATTVLAVDIGAESGRVMAVTAEDGRLRAEELHRFVNRPVRVGGTLHWDVLALWAEVQRGVEAGLALEPASVGVDTWAVDFALLDERGALLGNPVHYRDARTEGRMERLFERVDRRTVFQETGIQFLPINTLVQLFSLVEDEAPELRVARTLLTIPDLLHHWLASDDPASAPPEPVAEFTNATTTQLYDPRRGTWSRRLIEALGLPLDLFPTVVPPGTRHGAYRGVPVVLPASHDTGSAVAAVPLRPPGATRDAYISSGTWSLVGVEVDEPALGDDALAANVTNEGGVGGTFRLLKNVMGLWIIQQCRRAWAQQGRELDYAAIAEAAAAEPPLRSVVRVDDPALLPPGDHPEVIRRLCREAGEPVPDTVGRVARCVFDSLALAYADVLDTLERLTGSAVETVHVVGGGARNELLCRLTADATGKPVVAGPGEATVLGNALVQLIALGRVADLAEGRRWVAAGARVRRYEPSGDPAWREARARLAGARGERRHAPRAAEPGRSAT